MLSKTSGALCTKINPMSTKALFFDLDGTLLDTELNETVSMEEVYADRALLEQLFQRLQELDPDADRIIQLWSENDKISDRSIAEALGRKQRTFADQMKRIRTELRKVRGY